MPTARLPASVRVATASAATVLALAPAGLAQVLAELPTIVPTTAATWDAGRQRVLLAGEATGQRIFEWDPSGARERPGELMGHKTVQHLLYDHGAGRVVALSNDRWVGTWSGGSWSWRTGGTPPPVDVESSVVFDEARRRLVVITHSRVHEWDGYSWSFHGSHGVRVGTGLGYDPISQRCIAYGGTFAPSDTRSWDGFAWTVIPGASQPGPRGRAALALDPVSQQLVLHGGSTATDTWRFDGANWLQVPTTNDPGPQTRAHLVGTARGPLLLPTEGPDAGEVWRLESGTWQQLDLLPALPQSRIRTAFAYDEVRGTIVGFGGDQYAAPIPVDQTLLFDRRWLRARPNTNPPWRNSARAAWSDVEQMVLAFGGRDANTAFGDTWSWTGSDWVARQPMQSPAPRWNAVMSRDPGGGVMLFGGRDATTYFGDHWHWNGTDWQPVTPATLPSARTNSVHAYDPVRQQVVIFGGHSLAGIFPTETWVWDGIDWTFATTNTEPLEATTSAFRPASGRILALGQAVAYEWDGSDWLPIGGLGHGQQITVVPELVTHYGRGHQLCFLPAEVRRLVDIPASTESYASGCAIGPRPSLAAIDHPEPGTRFEIELTARAAGAPSVLALGFAAQNVPIGPGCNALIAQPVGTSFAFTTAGGIARLVMPLPNDATLRGVQFTVQGAVFDPARSPIGSLTFTAGMRVTIGD